MTLSNRNSSIILDSKAEIFITPDNNEVPTTDLNYLRLFGLCGRQLAAEDVEKIMKWPEKTHNCKDMHTLNQDEDWDSEDKIPLAQL